MSEDGKLVVPPGEMPKKVKRKIPPKSKEEYALEVDDIKRAIALVEDAFTGANKKRFNLPDEAPAKPEYAALIKALEHTVVTYGKLLQKPKISKATKAAQRAADGKSSSKNRGFKAERWAAPSIVKFINSYCELPADVQIKASAETGGLGIFSIAQCTQALQWYVDKHQLKGVKRSQIRLDANLMALFGEYLPTLDKKQSWEEGGQRMIAHTTLQVLIPKLFDRTIPVLQTMLTPETLTVMSKREEILRDRTNVNRARREKEAADAKNAKTAARLAQAIAGGAVVPGVTAGPGGTISVNTSVAK